MSRLKAKVALVTGGAAGLGKAIAQRLFDDGAVVVISDNQAEAGRATAAQLGITFLEHDVASEARWGAVVEDIERRFGSLDILVNNAGILGPLQGVDPESTSLELWKRIFAVNVEGVFLGCRAAIPAMRRAGGGSIINVSSIASLRATPHTTAYGASKAAVRHLTKSVAQHCAQEKLNIRCNSVHPGFVRTPLWDKGSSELAAARGLTLQDVVAESSAVVPMGDLTRPEDIAAGVAFLASEDARHITGSKLVIDGGLVSCSTYLANMQRRQAAAQPARPSQVRDAS